MRKRKPAFGLFQVLAPILYCGGLLYYFISKSGGVEEAASIGLGPTLLGLAAVGLLFALPLIVMIIRRLGRRRPPGMGGGGGPDEPTLDDEGGSNADAMIARYLANRPAEGAPGAAATRPAPQGGKPAPRSSFGRKSG